MLMKKAIVHGSYNTTNFGDLLLLDMIGKYLRNKWNIQSETPRLPKGISLEFCTEVKSIFNFLKPDYAILGGGGYLHDENGDPIITKRLLRYTIPAKIWKFLGVPYAIIGPGGGPDAVGKGAKRIAWLCQNAKFITLRDNVTSGFVNRIGVRRSDIVTTADLALTVKETDIPDQFRFNLRETLGLVSSSKKIIGVHLEKIYSDKEKFLEFCNLSFMSDHDFLNKFHIVFFYDYKTENIDFITDHLQTKYSLSYSIFERMNHWKTVDFLRQCDAVVTTKLHVSIVSSAFGVPIFGFSFHEKTARFYNQIGRAQFQKMWDSDLGCIDDWMDKLKNEDQFATRICDAKMKVVKDLAYLNYDVLDSYLVSMDNANRV